MTSSNGNNFRVTGRCAGNSPVAGEFPAKMPVTRGFDVFFDLRLNKRFNKQSWGWWFETPSRPLSWPAEWHVLFSVYVIKSFNEFPEWSQKHNMFFAALSYRTVRLCEETVFIPLYWKHFISENWKFTTIHCPNFQFFCAYTTVTEQQTWQNKTPSYTKWNMFLHVILIKKVFYSTGTYGCSFRCTVWYVPFSSSPWRKTSVFVLYLEKKKRVWYYKFRRFR